MFTFRPARVLIEIAIGPKRLSGSSQSGNTSTLSSTNPPRRVTFPVDRPPKDTFVPLFRGADYKLVNSVHGLGQERETQAMMMTTQYGDWDEFMDCYAKGQYNLGSPPPPPRGRPNFKYFVPPVPPNEGIRLTEVTKYNVEGGPKFSKACNSLLAAARKRFGLRGASISLLTKEAQIVKAEIGLNRNVIDRKISLEGNTILSLDPIVIGDTSQDWRFAKNPLVIHFPSISFWASAPIISPAGRPIGAISIWDAYPRENITIAQRRELQRFADAAMNEIEKEYLRHTSSIVAQNVEARPNDDEVSMYSAEEFDYPNAPRPKKSAKSAAVDDSSDKDANVSSPHRSRRVASIKRRRPISKAETLAPPVDHMDDKESVSEAQNENTKKTADADRALVIADLANSQAQISDDLRVTFRARESQEGQYRTSKDWSDCFPVLGDRDARFSSGSGHRSQQLYDKEQLLFTESSSIENFSRLPRSPALPFYRRSPFRELTNTYSFLAVLAKVAALSLGLDVAYFLEVGVSTSTDEHHAELDIMLYGDILGLPAPAEDDPADGLKLSKRLLASYGLTQDDLDFDAKLHYRALNSLNGLAYHNSPEESGTNFAILIPFRRYFESRETPRSTSSELLPSGTNSRASCASDRISSSLGVLQPVHHISQSAPPTLSHDKSQYPNIVVNSSTVNAANQELLLSTKAVEKLSMSADAKESCSVTKLTLQWRPQATNALNLSVPTGVTAHVSAEIARQLESNSQALTSDSRPSSIITTSPLKSSRSTEETASPTQSASQSGLTSADSASTPYTDRTSQSIGNKSTPATSVNVSPSEVTKPVPIAVLPRPDCGTPQEDVPSLIRAKSVDSKVNVWNQGATVTKKKPLKLTIDTTTKTKFSTNKASYRPVMTMLDTCCQPDVPGSYYTAAGSMTGISSCLTSKDSEFADSEAVENRFQCDGGIVFGGFSAAKKEYSQSDMEFIDKFQALVNEGIEWIR
ncbi:hypothetical protein V1525DRAFT_404502 [Lipomyces kononenkoae]|uniref:Uncharacterized protein n=1 Tax=Lipomyces kononenkoae TaxID=34357 RepID=A0ACC3T1B4_LIPKO